jgi:hypothetical protein
MDKRRKKKTRGNSSKRGAECGEEKGQNVARQACCCRESERQSECDESGGRRVDDAVAVV